MNCAYSKEVLALYIEGDLAEESAREVQCHLAGCGTCEEFCDELQRSQALLKSLRTSIATPAALSEVRQEVMSRIDCLSKRPAFAVRLERLLLPGFRRFRYAAACFAVFASLAVLSATVDGRRPPLPIMDAAVFDAKESLLRPQGYREWIRVGSAGEQKSVYIDPVAYRGFTETGRFPEGTVMVREADTSGSITLQVSVKDGSRFNGGWGYFGFTDRLQAKAGLEDGGCMSCHEVRAETDHVFTQFYPGLRKG